MTSYFEATTGGGDPTVGLLVRGVPPDTMSDTIRADFAKILTKHGCEVALDVVYPVRCLDEEVTAVLLLYSTAAMKCILQEKYDILSVEPLLCQISSVTVPLSKHLMEVVPFEDIKQALAEIQYKFAVKVSVADPPTIRGCYIQITEAERTLHDFLKQHKEYSFNEQGNQDALTSITREMSGVEPPSAAAAGGDRASSVSHPTYGRATTIEQRKFPETNTDFDTKTRDFSSHQQPANIPRDVNPEQRPTRHHKVKRDLTRTLPRPDNPFLGGEMISTYVSRNGNIAVHVYCMDITKLKVDAIVNAANTKMNHGAGVALAISKAAGPTLQRQCNEWIKRNGRLAVAKTTQTNGGQLPCNAVIHTVGPRWSDYKDKKDCCSDLFNAIRNCLQTAERSRYQSVALPPISCGIYGVPATTVAQMMYRACKQFCENGRISSIKEIHLVHIGHEYLQFLDQLFGQDSECFELSVSGGPGGYTHGC